MIRRHLRNLPEPDLPPGFRLKWYAPGDEVAWLEIHRDADVFNQFPPERFTREFGADAEALAARQCYILDPAETPVATGTAWYPPGDFAPGHGRVHWIAVRAAFQGNGLGKAIVATVCRRLADLDYGCACLTTSDRRPLALRLYRKFGFDPAPVSAAEAQRWQELDQADL